MLEYWFSFFFRLVVSNCFADVQGTAVFYLSMRPLGLDLEQSESEKSQGGEILAKEIRPGRERAGGKGTSRVEEGQSVVAVGSKDRIGWMVGV